MVLDNAITLYRRGESAKPAYKKTVRIVSNPADGTDLVDHWSAGDGLRLADVSAAMLAESFDAALLDMGAGKSESDIPFKTVRYLEGSAEKMERAQLIQERCNRMLLRTLRGELMSVPPRTPMDCTVAAK